LLQFAALYVSSVLQYLVHCFAIGHLVITWNPVYSS